MTAEDIEPAALAAIKSTVENASMIGALVALLIAKGIVTQEELGATVDEVRKMIVDQTAAKYNLSAAELTEVLR